MKELIARILFGKGKTDGSIEIHWSNESQDERCLASYKIFDKNNKLVLSAGINYYRIPPTAIIYIAYYNANKKGINNPSNVLLEDGEMTACGTTQPFFDARELALFEKYMPLIAPHLLK